MVERSGWLRPGAGAGQAWPAAQPSPILGPRIGADRRHAAGDGGADVEWLADRGRISRDDARHSTRPLVAPGAVDPLRALYERAAAAFGWKAEVLDAHAVYGAAVRHLLLAGHC